MKKLNNKGLTIIELIITFAILMLVILGMLKVITDIKSDVGNKSFAREMLDYKNTMTKTIYDDVIKLDFTKIEECETTSSTCKRLYFNKAANYKELSINRIGMIVTYDGINYPIPNSSELKLNNTLIETSNNVLTIEVSYFEYGTTNNLGFKIVHIYD